MTPSAGGAGGFAAGAAGGAASDASGVAKSAPNDAIDQAGGAKGLSEQSDKQQPDTGAGLSQADTGSGAGGAQAQAAEPAPALGAGGTSAAPVAPGAGDGVVPGGAGGKAVGAAAAVPAAGVAGQTMMLMMFLNWLKGILMQMAALAVNLWNMFLGAILMAVKTVVGFFMGIGAGIAGFFGGAVSAAAAGATSFFASIIAVVVVVAGAVVGVSATVNATAQRDGAISCEVPAQAALDIVEGQEGNADQITLANAQTVYSVLAAWGMPKENIAGILGNWQMESGIDPTGVEGIYDEKFNVGPQKKAAEDADFGGYTNANGDTMEVRGLGLGQWTNGRGQKLIDYAQRIGQPWHKLETQLGFMIGGDNPGSIDIVKDMIQTSLGTPGDAALHFHHVWEVSDDGQDGLDRRSEAATAWMGKFGGWTENKALADSILKQAGTTVTSANSSSAQAIRDECVGADAGSLTLKDGGLTLEEAQKLMDVYLSDGENFLVSRYGGGGPGDCGYGKADNCVGFSTYFVNKYTSFQQYAPGNGIDTAGSMANLMNKETTKVPTAYSVASGPGSGAEGHTFVVLGIEGDQAVIGEAACGTNHRGTVARYMPISELTNGSWEFVDVTDLMNTDVKF